MRIGLITYQHPHLKTEQVVHRLLGRQTGFEFRIYALPFVQRKARTVLIQHRPDQSQAAPPEYLAAENDISYIACGGDDEIDNACDLYLVLGAGILSPACIEGKRIINCHPGVIPACRGLDSFKWAIHEMKPMGVTLHYIDAEVDAGEIISILPTNVYATDTLEVLARRHYENEIDILSRFDELLGKPVNPFRTIETGEAKRRMPGRLEEELPSVFPVYLQKFANAGKG